MTRRTGSTLMEVLVTIGILGIGLTSAISLYPLAALTMGQALKDDRTTSCAVSADGYIRDYHQRYVVEVGEGTAERYYRALDNPALDDPGNPLPALATDSAGPSYPVVIDPMGWHARVGRSDQNRMGDPATPTNLPRRNLNLITDPLMALNLFSQRDGLSYDEDGNVRSGREMRDYRYLYLNVVQRPVNRDRFNLTLKVVVFNNRTHMYAPPGSEVPQPAQFTPGQTTITGVPLTADLRKGTWIMDATIQPGTTLLHANFYRVLSVTEVGTTYSLEVHSPIRRVDGQSGAYSGTLLVMSGVTEVFERPMLTGSVSP